MSSNNRNSVRYQHCNGLAIRSLRQARGWTQTDLAKIAGYSVRLVQKAEASGSLVATTLDVLAQSLGTGDSPVEIDDITTTPQTIVQEFIELINSHHGNTGQAARHLLADDAVLWCAGDPEVMPFAGDWNGPEAIAKFFQVFFSVLTPAKDGFLRNKRYLANGNEVVCWCEAHASVSGMPSVPVWVWHHYLLKDGKILRYENHFDTQTETEHLAEARARGLLAD